MQYTMNETILRTRNITKEYGGKAAVDDVSMTISKGDIYGLIGRNGAGKTTLMKIITSLTKYKSGEVELFGETSAAELNNARRRTGCVIEMPALYPNLTAVQNLEYYRILRGIPDKSVVDKALETVSLTDTGKKKFKEFSLGMKQRLGLALSLLNNPDFIILDEPVNGLDPVGIIEMRETFKRLNKEHDITIMISSHLLSELSMTATRYGIINNGKLIKELTNDELKEQCKQCLSVTVDNLEKALSIIESVMNTTKYKVIKNREIHLYDYLDTPSEVTFQLNSNGVRVESLSEVSENLEDYFMSLIGGK